MIYVMIDCMAILVLCFTISAMKQIKEDYGEWIRRALVAAILAILANIAIACSFSKTSANVAYAVYFASIDWIIFYLTAFCLGYTEHYKIIRKFSGFAHIVMAADTISIIANLIFGHVFYIYETTNAAGSVFYETGFYIPYYVHLAIDYIALLAAFVAIVYRIFRCYSLYRTKYVMMLCVLLLVVALNVVYMAFGLLLDASVILYAVAGTLIYFSIQKFVPRSLMVASIGRAINDMKEGLILFDMGVFSAILYDQAQAIMIIYVVAGHLIAALLNIVRTVGNKRDGNPGWKIDLAQFIGNIILVALCLIFIKYVEIPVLIYGAGAIYSSVLTMISSCRRTAIVYVQ